MSKIRLIKFRSLTGPDDLRRTEKIIETGKFHCSKLWDLNDPMEGVYKTANTPNINEVFSEKNKYVICSFSSKETLKNPLLWGYYADGYKGIAIEIEYCEKYINDVDNERIDNYSIVKVNYVDDNVEINNYDTLFQKIISYKLKLWEHEDEYRYLKKLDSGEEDEYRYLKKSNPGEEGKFEIGEIKNVYFGNPYSNTINEKRITDASEILKEYKKNETALKAFCKNKKIDFVDYTPYQ